MLTVSAMSPETYACEYLNLEYWLDSTYVDGDSKSLDYARIREKIKRFRDHLDTLNYESRYSMIDKLMHGLLYMRDYKQGLGLKSLPLYIWFELEKQFNGETYTFLGLLKDFGNWKDYTTLLMYIQEYFEDASRTSQHTIHDHHLMDFEDAIYELLVNQFIMDLWACREKRFNQISYLVKFIPKAKKHVDRRVHFVQKFTQRLYGPTYKKSRSRQYRLDCRLLADQVKQKNGEYPSSFHREGTFDHLAARPRPDVYHSLVTIHEVLQHDSRMKCRVYKLKWLLNNKNYVKTHPALNPLCIFKALEETFDSFCRGTNSANKSMTPPQLYHMLQTIGYMFHDVKWEPGDDAYQTNHYKTFYDTYFPYGVQRIEFNAFRKTFYSKGEVTKCSTFYPSDYDSEQDEEGEIHSSDESSLEEISTASISSDDGTLPLGCVCEPNDCLDDIQLEEDYEVVNSPPEDIVDTGRDASGSKNADQDADKHEDADKDEDTVGEKYQSWGDWLYSKFVIV